VTQLNNPLEIYKLLLKRSENLFVNSLAAQNKTDEKYNSDQTSEIWGELAEEYDIRNATHDQLCGIAKKLLDAGQISSREFAVLTFDMDKLLQVLKADSLKGGPPVTASSL